MRRGCQPSLVGESGEPTPLRRVEFSDQAIAETFLQDLLHRAPETLPVDELDSSFGPLISLGREISNIDNLFISPNGRLTIVETKLWRNPEATRQVVAQILDYAARVSRWSYADLETKARTEALHPTPLGSQSLYDFVAARSEDVLPESEFVDAVQQTLRTGRFLLLIVGDGIRESIEPIVGSLHNHPQKLFTFGLVQLQVFEDPHAGGGHLVVPQIVAHTTEIYRYVINVQTTGEATVSVEIENREPEKAGAASRHTLSEEEFFSQISDSQQRDWAKQLLDFGVGIRAVPVWGKAGVSVRLRDPAGSKTRFTLFVLTTSGNLYFGWLPQQMEATGRPVQIAAEFARQMCALFPSLSMTSNELETEGVVSTTEVGAKWDDFVQVITNFTARLEPDSQG